MKRIKEWILGCVGLILGFLGVNLLIFKILFPGPKKRWEQDTYDCAVVCGYHAEEGGSPSRVMKCRVEKAAELWSKKFALDNGLTNGRVTRYNHVAGSRVVLVFNGIADQQVKALLKRSKAEGIGLSVCPKGL